MIATPPEPIKLSISQRRDKLDVCMEFDDEICSHARFALCSRLIRKHHTKLVSECVTPRRQDHKEMRQYLVEEIDVSIIEESQVYEEIIVTESVEASYAVAVTCTISSSNAIQSFTVELDSILLHALAQCRGLDSSVLNHGEWELELVMVPLSNVVVSKDDCSANVAIISPLGLETVLSLARARTSVELNQTPHELEQRYGGLIEQMRHAYIQRTHPPKMNGVLLAFPSPHVSRAPSICPSPIGKMSPLLEVVSEPVDEEVLLPPPVAMDDSSTMELLLVDLQDEQSPMSASLSPCSPTPSELHLEDGPKQSRSPSTTSATLSVGTNDVKRASEDEDPVLQSWCPESTFRRFVVSAPEDSGVSAPEDELTHAC